MTSYSNPTNIFNFIPNDVLTHVINPFLSGEDRFNFNAVLEPTERLYKKFPTDFAIHHSIRTFAPMQRAHGRAVQNALRDFEHISERLLFPGASAEAGDDELKKKALLVLKRYVGFLNSVQATVLIEYRPNAKDCAISDMQHFLSEECSAYPFIKPKFRATMEKVLENLQKTYFVREVVVPKDFSV
jgi:hypothetical protein